MAADFRKVIEVVISTLNKSGPGAKEAAADLQRFGAEAVKVGSTMATVGASVLTVLTGIAVAAANSADQIRDLAVQSGSTAETMSTLKFAAQQTGTSIEAVAQGMKFLAKNAVEADQGNTDLAEGFAAIGVSVRTTSGQLKTSEQLLLDVADGLAGVQDASLATNLSLKLLGRGSVEMTEFLKQGSSGIAELQQRARDLGGEISTKTAAAADDFNDSLAETKTAVGGLSQVVGAALLPTLTNLARNLTDVVVATQAWSKEHPGLVKNIATLAAVLVGAGGLVAAIGTVSTAFTVAGPIAAAGWAAITGPVGLIAAAAVGLTLIAAKVVQVNRSYLALQSSINQTSQGGAGRSSGGGGASGAGGDEPVPGGSGGGAAPRRDQLFLGGTSLTPRLNRQTDTTRSPLPTEPELQSLGLAIQQSVGEQVFLAASAGLEALRESFGGMASFAVNALANVADAFAGAFVDALFSGQNALAAFGKAFKQWAAEVISQLVAVIAKAAILAGIFSIFGLGGGGGFGGAFKKIIGFASGGVVGGGIAGRDSVPALLAPGEIVLPKDVAGGFRSLASGGGVGGGSVNVTIQAGAFMDSRFDATELGRRIGLSIDEWRLGKVY